MCVCVCVFVCVCACVCVCVCVPARVYASKLWLLITKIPSILSNPTVDHVIEGLL